MKKLTFINYLKHVLTEFIVSRKQENSFLWNIVILFLRSVVGALYRLIVLMFTDFCWLYRAKKPVYSERRAISNQSINHQGFDYNLYFMSEFIWIHEMHYEGKISFLQLPNCIYWTGMWNQEIVHSISLKNSHLITTLQVCNWKRPSLLSLQTSWKLPSGLAVMPK